MAQKSKNLTNWLVNNLRVWIRQSFFAVFSLKKRCSEIAGKTVCDLIKANNNSAGLMRLLQIRDNSYYYAKISDSKVSLMYVPSSKEFKEIISVSSVDYIVPSSQLNIITTIHNTKNNNDLKLRNECRFSHGQFNGTPEAKMYFDKQTNLSSIYVNLIK